MAEQLRSPDGLAVANFTAVDSLFNMQKIIGAICLGAGIALLVWGHNVSQSVNSQMKNLFTGSPSDKAVWLYIGGGVLLAVGIVQLSTKRK